MGLTSVRDRDDPRVPPPEFPQALPGSGKSEFRGGQETKRQGENPGVEHSRATHPPVLHWLVLVRGPGRPNPDRRCDRRHAGRGPAVSETRGKDGDRLPNPTRSFYTFDGVFGGRVGVLRRGWPIRDPSGSQVTRAVSRDTRSRQPPEDPVPELPPSPHPSHLSVALEKDEPSPPPAYSPPR